MYTNKILHKITKKQQQIVFIAMALIERHSIYLWNVQ